MLALEALGNPQRFSRVAVLCKKLRQGLEVKPGGTG
jgi:hypothetical protein